VGLPCEFLRLDATVHVSPQSAASIRAPCPVATTATRSDLAAGLFDFGKATSLPSSAQSCFLGQAEEVFKGVDSGEDPSPLAVAESESVKYSVIAIAGKQTQRKRTQQPRGFKSVGV